jgi:hypothetical protein
MGTLRAQLTGALKAHDIDTANQLRDEIADMEGAPMRAAQVTGLNLANAAQKFQNTIAPEITKLDNMYKRTQIHSMLTDTPATRAAYAASLAELNEKLREKSDLYDRQLDQVYATDPNALMKDLQGVTTSMQNSSKTLQTETGTGVMRRAPVMNPIQYEDPTTHKITASTLGAALSTAQQLIASSDDPLGTYTALMSDPLPQSAALRENPEVMTYLSGVAMQHRLLSKLQGSTTLRKAPGVAGAPNAGPIAGLNLGNRPQSRFSPFALPTGPFSFGQQPP